MNTVSIEKSRKTAVLSVRTISMTAMLSAVAYLLAFVEFPVPLSPSFARMDLSDLPALIGAFAFGPLSGLLIELVKNALQLLTTSTGGIGEIANFLMGAAYVVTAGFIYKRHKTKKTALAACVLASVVMGIAAALANYFILLPLFENFMPLDQLIASFAEFLPFIHTKLDVVLFNALYQGIPNGGYTAMVEKMLDGTEVRLNVDYLADRENLNALAEKVVYTGPVDAYFGYRLGALQYRSVRFETEVLDTDNYQGNAVVNYTDAETPYTRIIEHKHFEFGTQPKTVISREYSAEWKKGDEPYYPVNDEKNGALYAEYKKLADAEPDVIFGGRLGEYKYYDMDKVIEVALDVAAKELA